MKPAVKVVAFDDIRMNLPSGHPTLTPDERAAVLQERYQAVNKRRNPTGQFDAQVQTSGGSSGCSVSRMPTSDLALWALVGLSLPALRRRH